MNFAPLRAEARAAATRALLLAASAAIAFMTACNEKPAEKPPERLAVFVEPAAKGEVAEEFRAVGTTKPVRDAELASEALGRVTWLAPIGAKLGAGSIAAKLELLQSDAALEGAKARLESARVEERKASRDLERARRLHDGGAGSRQSLDDAEDRARAALLAVEAAEAAVSEARAVSGRSTITAPFASEMLLHRTEVGQIVSPGAAVARVGEMSRLEIELQVSERAARSIESGSNAWISFDALPTESVIAKVSRVDRALAAQSRTATIVVDLPNRDGKFIAGMTARARLVGTAKPDAVSVPLVAVQRDPDGDFVWTIVEDRAAKRPVKLGIRAAERQEILSGITPGESIVTRGGESLSEGSLVAVQSR